MWNLRIFSLLIVCVTLAHVVLSLPIQVPQASSIDTSGFPTSQPARRVPGRKKPAPKQPQAAAAAQPPGAAPRPPGAAAQQPGTSAQRPPATAQRPPAAGQRPPATAQRPPATAQQPAAGGSRPPAGGQRPPAGAQGGAGAPSAPARPQQRPAPQAGPSRLAPNQTPKQQKLPRKFHKNDDPNDPKTDFEPVDPRLMHSYYDEHGNIHFVTADEINAAATTELGKLRTTVQPTRQEYPKPGSGFRNGDNDPEDPSHSSTEKTSGGVSYHFPVGYTPLPGGGTSPGPARIVAAGPPNTPSGAPDSRPLQLTPTFHDALGKPLPSTTVASGAPGPTGQAQGGTRATNHGFSRMNVTTLQGPVKSDGSWRRRLYRLNFEVDRAR